MDETVVNGAQIFYKREFGIDSGSMRHSWLTGLTNSAPYLCCAVAGCCKYIYSTIWQFTNDSRAH